MRLGNGQHRAETGVEALREVAGQLEVLAVGAAKARAVAATTLAQVYDRVGFLPARRPVA